ncbi:hypothetical protein GW17_00062431 [Ensete ventricosum]|nr:hypothetical protein GW17_00062431 [Ensete ventricosum]
MFRLKIYHGHFAVTHAWGPKRASRIGAAIANSEIVRGSHDGEVEMGAPSVSGRDVHSGCASRSNWPLATHARGTPAHLRLRRALRRPTTRIAQVQSYQHQSVGSHQNSEVKSAWARVVLGKVLVLHPLLRPHDVGIRGGPSSGSKFIMATSLSPTHGARRDFSDWGRNSEF